MDVDTSVRPCEYTNMTSASHSHPLDAQSVAAAQRGGISGNDAELLAQLLSLLSDPVRIRILFALVSTEELCVGDIAMALDVSMDQSSYALKQLRTSGLVQSRRDGRVMYYRLADGFPHQLLDHCLRQLLTIASKENLNA